MASTGGHGPNGWVGHHPLVPSPSCPFSLVEQGTEKLYTNKPQNAHFLPSSIIPHPQEPAHPWNMVGGSHFGGIKLRPLGW